MIEAIAKLYAWYGVHPRLKSPKRTPAKFGLSFEEVSFNSNCSKGVKLAGWFIPVENPKAVILLCHGVDANASCLVHKAAIFAKAGFSTLLFDFRANGRSEGEYSTLGFLEKEDVLGAVNYLGTREDAKNLKIFALGESLGGSAIIRAAAETDKIRAIISEATFASLKDAIKQRLKPLGKLGDRVYSRLEEIARVKYDIDLEEVSPEIAVRSISPRPILFIVCGWDALCSKEESERLYNAAGDQKERWDAKRALHTFACRTHPEEYKKRVTDFFLKALQTEQTEESASTSLPYSPESSDADTDAAHAVIGDFASENVGKER